MPETIVRPGSCAEFSAPGDSPVPRWPWRQSLATARAPIHSAEAVRGRPPAGVGLSAAAIPHVEYQFATGDRVDVMFENHLPDRTVIEIEVAGEREICVGVHQAIKYRSLAAADAGCPLLTSRVRSLVVAYSTEYARARELADRYDIPLISVDRDKVLTPVL